MSNNQSIKETIHANGIDISIYTKDFKTEYISLTDIARFRSTDPRFTIHSWLRSRDIVEFLGLWECLYNPTFKRVDFDTFKWRTKIKAARQRLLKWGSDQVALKRLSSLTRIPLRRILVQRYCFIFKKQMNSASIATKFEMLRHGYATRQ